MGETFFEMLLKCRLQFSFYSIFILTKTLNKKRPNMGVLIWGTNKKSGTVS